MAFGQPVELVPHLDKAKVIVALDADFLGLDTPSVLPTKQYSPRAQIRVGSGFRKGEPAVCGGEPVLADRRERGPSFADAFGRSEAVRDGSGVGAGRRAGTECRAGSTDKRGKFLAAVVKDLKAAGKGGAGDGRSAAARDCACDGGGNQLDAGQRSDRLRQGRQGRRWSRCAEIPGRRNGVGAGTDAGDPGRQSGVHGAGRSAIRGRHFESRQLRFIWASTTTKRRRRRSGTFRKRIFSKAGAMR